MQREDQHPSAHNAFVESGEIFWLEPGSGNQMRHAQLRQVGDITAGMENSENEIVVAAGSEMRAATIERGPKRMMRDSLRVEESMRAPHNEAGTDRCER